MIRYSLGMIDVCVRNMKEYEKRVERLMRIYYDSLSEKDKRHYAAVEAAKLEHGGIAYISELFGCCRQTVSAGLEELKKNMTTQERIRREGGGRMSAEEQFKNIDTVFLSVVSDHIAGDPMNENIKWIKLTRHEISIAMKKLGVSVSRNIIKKLLKKHNFVKRKMQRKTATGEFRDRNKQFRNINKLKMEYMESDNPVLSMDTKKKEKIGNLHRAGEVYCTQGLESYDHDYPYLAEGVLVPHGIYDMKYNAAFITIGMEHETADFVCDSIKSWWKKAGKKTYDKADEILIYCDAGGANSYRHGVFKFALQNLVNEIGLPIRICHYPPYASKWNPIEHKVFPHITRAMSGVKLESIEGAKELIKKTHTKTGLKVLVNTTKKIYKTGIKITKDILEKINIVKHGQLGQLNYTVSPMVA